MSQAHFEFFAELNDFLPRGRQGAAFVYAFEDHPSLKHLIEALGIPHPEVARVEANGSAVDLSYQPQDGDRIQVYPVSLLSPEEKDRRNQPAGEQRFVVDNHLGRLAVYLRMLGFDVLYHNDYADEEMARVASQEDRILLTRDRRLLMRSVVKYGYWVRSQFPQEQLREVVRRFNLAPLVGPFRRCLRCNGRLQPVSKEAVLHRLEPLTRRYYDEFHICPDCGGIYWKGTHYEHMLALIQDVLRAE
jgi:uncharacterized protein with PIN domain/sulfur carrier protein ThiS